ncbi:hypothetical protein DL770_009791 [Monosporascus sp. CRB-9-2]|nr:hypothetical protein DL770_009791 [Monosporascus sp. CRB-9-2]
MTKLVIVGGTGLVATELIKQNLAMHEITSIVAVARKPVQLEADAANKIQGTTGLCGAKTVKIVREFGAEHKEVDVHIVRPGMVLSSIAFWRSVQANMFRAANALTRAIPNINRTELSAAILDQAVRGFEKEALSNADLGSHRRGSSEEESEGLNSN